LNDVDSSGDIGLEIGIVAGSFGNGSLPSRPGIRYRSTRENRCHDERDCNGRSQGPDCPTCDAKQSAGEYLDKKQKKGEFGSP